MKTAQLSTTAIRRLIQTATAKKKATTVISNISLVNVYSREIQSNFSVGLCQDRIIYIGPDPKGLIGSRTQVISGQGRFLLPGFIDAHTHLDSIFTAHNYIPYALATGNTTIITEMGTVANVFGRKGVNWFMQESSGLPLKIFYVAPVMTPPFPEIETSQGMNPKELAQVINMPQVLGIGEAYWPRVVHLDPRILNAFTQSHKLNKTREGHAAGARDKNMLAYVAAGATSCHEATTLDEALERLRMGMAVMIRDGFVRSELEAIAPIARSGLDLSRLMLVSDTFHTGELAQGKGMNTLLARAVALGFDPLTAVQMGTQNPATYFGLKELGGIAPGKVADLILVDDLTHFNCLKVWTNGQLVWDQGTYLAQSPPFRYPLEAGDSFAMTKVDPEIFSLPFSEPEALVRTVKAVNQTITKEGRVTLKSKNGLLHADPRQDCLKMAVIQRMDKGPKPSLGFCQGIGLKKGAVATSLFWDANNILVIGVSDQDMALAVNRLLQIKGGWVVSEGEHILAEIPMPVMGVISEEPLPVINEQIDALEKTIQDLGSALERPFLTIQTFCFTGLPFIRLTDKGLADIRKNELVDLFLP
jgi:adenine deaminase